MSTAPAPNPHFQRLRADARAMLALPELFGPSALDVEIHGREAADALLRLGLDQLAAGRGATDGEPLVGLGVAGFYLLARACDFDVARQSAVFRDDRRVLDRMEIEAEDADGRYVAVLFNLVEPEE